MVDSGVSVEVSSMSQKDIRQFFGEPPVDKKENMSQQMIQYVMCVHVCVTSYLSV